MYVSISLNIARGSSTGKLADSSWLELRGDGMRGVDGALWMSRGYEGFGIDIVLRCADLPSAARP
jgi:hypothetical protein